MNASKKDYTFDLCKNLLAANSQKFSDITNKNSGWGDAVEALSSFKSLRDIAYYKQPITKDRQDHIHRRLGHIVVNPKDKYNTAALIDTYIYYGDKGPVDNLYVNSNPNSTDNLLETLVNNAHVYGNSIFEDRIDDGTMRSASIGGNMFILHGRRGSGKTFYLNHVFSKFDGYFDDNKILWIRINLINDFGDNKSITHWMYAQLARIIFRFYDPNSPLFRKQAKSSLSVKPINILYDYINSEIKDKQLKLYLKEKIEGMRQVFQNIKIIEAVTPELVPEVLGRKLFNHLLAKGFRFIFVLDGLDRLEALIHQEDKFHKLCSSIRNEIVRSFSPYVLLLVTRTNSLPIIVKYTLGATESYADNEKKLLSISFDRILDKRLEYIEKEVKLISETHKELRWSLDDWPDHLNDFRSFIFFKQKPIFYIELESIYGENRRAQMQTVQLQYFEFLNEKTKIRYRLVESLMRAGREFPPKAYTYRIARDGTYLEREMGNNLFDNHFIPNIFRFPYCADSNHPEKHLMLAGLRIIQIVESHFRKREEMGKEDKMIDKIKPSELADIGYYLFNYPRDIILRLIEEFGEYEIFFVGGVGLFEAPSADEYKPIPMPKMQYIYNHLLYEIAYLNLCSVRIPFNKELLRISGKPIIKAIRYDIEEDKLGWITQKIINGISMFNIIRRLNATEKQLFDDNFSKLSDKRIIGIARYAKECGMFNITANLKDRLEEQIKNIIFGSIKNEKEITFLIKIIEEYNVNL